MNGKMTDPVLIVCSSPARNLDFFNARTHEKLTTLENLIAQPHEIAWDSKRRLAYVTHTYRHGGYGEPVPKGSEISVIDPESRVVVDVIELSPYVAPHDVEYDAAGDLIITGVEFEDGRNGVIFIDPDTRTIVGNVSTVGRNCHWLAVTPNRMLFVAHKEEPFISVIDVAARRLVKMIELPGGAEEIDASPDGRYVFAVTPKFKGEKGPPGSGKLYKFPREEGDPIPRLVKIDTGTQEIVGETALDDYSIPVRVGSDNRVYVGQWAWPYHPDSEVAESVEQPAMGYVIVIDGDQMREICRIPVGRRPFTTRVSPDGSTAWVSGFDTGLVSVINLRTFDIEAVLQNNPSDGLGGTHGLCYVPAG